MTKKTITLLLLLVVILAACQSSTPSATEPAALETETEQPATSLPSETAPPPPEASPTAPAEQAFVQGAANCTVVSRQPTPSPTEQSIVPLISETDWAHGPETAKVTIIEYGDFQ